MSERTCSECGGSYDGFYMAFTHDADCPRSRYGWLVTRETDDRMDAELRGGFLPRPGECQIHRESEPCMSCYDVADQQWSERA